MRQRRQRRRQLDDVDARQRTLLRHRQFQRADAFDGDVAGLALAAFEPWQRDDAPAAGVHDRALERDQELVPGPPRRHVQHQPAVDHVGALVRRAGEAGEREPVRQPHGQRRGRALDHRDVEDRRDAQIVLADGDERLDVVEEPQRADRRGRPGVARRPADARPAARRHRRIDDQPALRPRPPRDQRAVDGEIGSLARRVDRRADRAGAELRQLRRGPPRLRRDGAGPLDLQRERRRPAAPRGTRRAAAGSARPLPAPAAAPWAEPGLSRGRTRGSTRFLHQARADQRAAREQRHGGRPVAQDLALQGDRAAQQFAVDAQREIGLRDEGARRRHGDGDGGIGGAIDEAVVLREADRDGVRRGHRLRDRGRRRGRQDDAGNAEGDEVDAHDHFTARLKVNAAVGDAPSAVSAAAR